MSEPVLLVSCEHAVDHVPSRYDGLFQEQPEVLAGHRGGGSPSEAWSRIKWAPSGSSMLTGRSDQMCHPQ